MDNYCYDKINTIYSLKLESDFLYINITYI